ncbi:hypothetical protein [Streptomyces sp. AK02-01A]|uniref:hypothetical protein n=1 Tax=Streptomyces sp. AK02-01A TaxID=3028648 RepID=UPI0029B82EC6|nr:hypothetical protein [Streptomyces sp. AK02-01A]MDX3853593.1 hypothetical protein [Streptomyces sp. AK02-01A]
MLKTIRRDGGPWAMIGDMSRYAFLAAPSAVADAPKAAALLAPYATAVLAAVAAAAVAAAAAAPFGGARS